MKSIWQKKKISLGQDITSKAYKKTSMPVGIFVYIVNVYVSMYVCVCMYV